MPSKSKKQHNLMEAVAHSPAFAKKVGISQSVGADFAQADKGKKFTKGGDVMASVSPAMLKRMMAKKAGKGAAMEAPAVAAPTQTATPGMGMGMKKGGKTVKKMASGGIAKVSAKETMGSKTMGKVKVTAPSKDGIAQRGKTKTKYPSMGGNKIGNGPLVHTK